MSERDAYLRAICGSPEDDSVRLVYADWLEEHGDAVRAEFIRLQCKLDAENPFAPGRRALLRREWQLLRQHGERWIREDGLAHLVAPDLPWHYRRKTRFRRGFIDRTSFLSPDDFLRAAPDWFARAPITGIDLHRPYTIPPEQEQWFHNTYLVVVNAVRGTPAWHQGEPRGTAFPEPDEFRRFVASPWFARLRSFAMNTIFSDRRHLEILAASPAASHLRELDLSKNICLFGAAWAVLAESPILDGLQALLLDKCEIGMDGLRTLVNSPHLANLQRLSLEGEGERGFFGAEGIALICGSRALPQLRELNVCGQAGGAAGLHTLAAWPGLARLTRLDISHFGVWEDTLAESVAAWTAFTHSPNWGSLCELNLEGGESVELEAFLDSPNLGTLRVLTFEFPFHRYGDPEEQFIQDEAAALLARCPHFADDLELQIPSEGLSKNGRRLLQDRFGERLILYPADGGAHRQPGDWASGRPSRSTFHSEERHPEKPPRS
jgi:uncharacterized protein (TIGR02996 family)